MATTRIFGSSATVQVSTNDVSSQTRAIAWTFNREAHDKTAFGDKTRKHGGGLYDWAVDLDLYIGDSSMETSATAWIGQNVAICADNGGATFSGTAYCEGGNILEGTIGDQQVMRLKFSSAGDLSGSGITLATN